ncbi:hypothetical protein BC826DRAFT_1178829 [Russula brevipes]|nr:hypothetical protein BC826DRAFT_1178829 [Russula brevipes]
MTIDREIHPPPPKDLRYADAPKKQCRQSVKKASNEQLRYCVKILDQLGRKQHSTAVGPFSEPVNWVKLSIPDYPKIVKKPMDLGTMPSIRPQTFLSRRGLFSGAKKPFALLISLGRATVYVLTGLYGQPRDLGAGVCLLLITRHPILLFHTHALTICTSCPTPSDTSALTRSTQHGRSRTAAACAGLYHPRLGYQQYVSSRPSPWFASLVESPRWTVVVPLPAIMVLEYSSPCPSREPVGRKRKILAYSSFTTKSHIPTVAGSPIHAVIYTTANSFTTILHGAWHDYLSRNGCVSLLGYHPPGLTVSAPPSFHPFGVDSRQRDANATRPQPWRRGQSVLALANESMTSRRRHDTCRGTSKPTIVLILTALNHLSSTPSSAFRSAWAALSKILDTVDRLRHMHDPVRYLEWQLNVDPLTLHDFQSRASKISPDLDPSDGTPPTGAGAVHAPECESHQLQLTLVLPYRLLLPAHPACVGSCGQALLLSHLVVRLPSRLGRSSISCNRTFSMQSNMCHHAHPNLQAGNKAAREGEGNEESEEAPPPYDTLDGLAMNATPLGEAAKTAIALVASYVCSYSDALKVLFDGWCYELELPALSSRATTGLSGLRSTYNFSDNHTPSIFPRDRKEHRDSWVSKLEACVEEDRTNAYFFLLEGGRVWDCERWWHKLTHVCPRWRNLILRSTSHLSLCLVCTYGTPIVDVLAHSPRLPLILDYDDENRDITAEEEDAILLALGHRDRVRRIRLSMPVQKLQKLVTSMSNGFPALEDVVLGPLDELDIGLVLPKTFQAPQLRHLLLRNFAFPIQRSPLLMTAVGIVALSLVDIHRSAYFPPNDFSNSFHSCRNWRHSELPFTALFLTVMSKGNYVYEHDRVVQAPTSATFTFYDRGVAMGVSLPTTSGQHFFAISVLGSHLDWQVSSIAQIFNVLGPVFSTVEHLSLSHEEHSQSSAARDVVEGTQWRNLLGSFSNLKTVHVPDSLFGELSRCLKSGDGESSVQLFPEVDGESISASGDVGGAFVSFIDAHQNASHRVTLVRY